MVDDAPVSGSRNAMSCRPSGMAGAVTITRLAEAASGRRKGCRHGGAGVGSEAHALDRDRGAAIHAGAGRSRGIRVKDSSRVAVVGTSVAAIVDDS